MREEQESKFISIPAEVYNQIEERVKTTGFTSVDEYVLFVLEEVLKDEEGEEEQSYSKEEEEEVKKRLKALGYL